MPVKDKTNPTGLDIPLSSAEQDIVNQIQQLRPQAQRQAEQFGKQWFELRKLVKKTKDRFSKICESLHFPRSTAYLYINQYESHLAENATLPGSVTEMATRNYLDVNDQRNKVALGQVWIRAGSPSNPSPAEVAKIYASTVRTLSPRTEKSKEEKVKSSIISASKRYMKLAGSAETKDLIGIVSEASREYTASSKK
jgi:hypothetical protein